MVGIDVLVPVSDGKSVATDVFICLCALMSISMAGKYDPAIVFDDGNVSCWRALAVPEVSRR
jgi:hypothetical protein